MPRLPMSMYLNFELDREASATRKTDVWRVYSYRSGDLLGTIKWFGRWRQYAFFPEPETIWNNDCLASVESFIVDLKREWKEKARAFQK